MYTVGYERVGKMGESGADVMVIRASGQKVCKCLRDDQDLCINSGEAELRPVDQEC